MHYAVNSSGVSAPVASEVAKQRGGWVQWRFEGGLGGPYPLDFCLAPCLPTSFFS